MVQNITNGVYGMHCPEGPCSKGAGKTTHRDSR